MLRPRPCSTLTPHLLGHGREGLDVLDIGHGRRRPSELSDRAGTTRYELLPVGLSSVANFYENSEMSIYLPAGDSQMRS